MSISITPVPTERQFFAVLLCRSREPAEVDKYSPDEDILRSWLNYRFFPPVSVHVVNAGHAANDRKSALATVTDLIRAKQCRFVLLSSLDWIGTGSDVFDFLELADKSRTSVVAVNDGADTHETDWRIIAMCAAMKRGLVSAGCE